MVELESVMLCEIGQAANTVWFSLLSRSYVLMCVWGGCGGVMGRGGGDRHWTMGEKEEIFKGKEKNEDNTIHVSCKQKGKASVGPEWV